MIVKEKEKQKMKAKTNQPQITASLIEQVQELLKGKVQAFVTVNPQRDGAGEVLANEFTICFQEPSRT